LACNPPPEFFLAAYFRAKFKWQPPEPESASLPEPPRMSDEDFEAYERSFAVQD
jgi:hypothetical protein